MFHNGNIYKILTAFMNKWQELADTLYTPEVLGGRLKGEIRAGYQ